MVNKDSGVTCVCLSMAWCVRVPRAQDILVINLDEEDGDDDVPKEAPAGKAVDSSSSSVPPPDLDSSSPSSSSSDESTVEDPDNTQSHRLSPYPCPRCGAAFLRELLRFRHLRREHQDLTFPDPRDCAPCQKHFATICGRREHENTHLGMRPYACPSCSYRSNGRGGLWRHMKRHHTVPVAIMAGIPS